MTVIGERIAPAPPPPPPAAAGSAPAIARRTPEDAGAPDGSPAGGGGEGRGALHARFSSGAPDPSGRSGSLIDVFA